jgi:hypothetical protein
MAVSVIVRVEGGRLSPASAAEAETLLGVKPGDYTAELKRSRDPRSVRQNNMVHGICQIIATDLCDPRWSKDTVRDLLKVETGHVTWGQSPNGKLYRFPKSTDFEAMDSREFSEWLNRALPVLAVEFYPHISPDAVTRIESILSGEGRTEANNLRAVA